MSTVMRKFRYMAAMLFGTVVVFLLLSPAFAQNKLKLKAGATGKVCITCHVAFGDKLKSKFLHTPVKTGKCSSCHNPHAASHDKLLYADADKICAQCHGEMAPSDSASKHQAVVEGKCVLCHDPHGSDNKANLVRKGSDLCFGCHADLKDSLTGIKFRHNPVDKGCLTCHDPHASKKAEKLLARAVPDLCLNCHQTNKLAFKSAHMNYPVQSARCTSCHNPHGSDRGAILYDNVHSPIENKMCNQCHQDASSKEPFKLQKRGYELCRSCHYEMVNDALNKNRMHWPMLDERGCVNCHSPHASSEDKLLQRSPGDVCGSCHEDTIQRLADSPVKHVPVADGNCTSCHAPHSSDSVFLLNRPTVIDVCAGCHNWKAHTSHPIGPKVVDKRNKNLTVNCLSCHRTHGIENENLLHFGVLSDMCVQCHVKFKR